MELERNTLRGLGLAAGAMVAMLVREAVGHQDIAVRRAQIRRSAAIPAPAAISSEPVIRLVILA